MSFTNILSNYRKYSFSERDKGDRFERLMQAYLLTDPQYANQFKNVFKITKAQYGGTGLVSDCLALFLLLS